MNNQKKLLSELQSGENFAHFKNNKLVHRILYKVGNGYRMAMDEKGNEYKLGGHFFVYSIETPTT